MIGEVIKTIIGLSTSIGVGQVVSNIVSVTTPGNIDKTKKIYTAIGGFVLSGVLGSLAAEHVEKKMDEFTDLFGKKTEE